MTGEKRRLGLAALSFPLVLSVLLFVLFWAGIFLGIVPMMCGSPLEKLLPAYFWGGLVLSIAVSGFTSVRFHRWLSERAQSKDTEVRHPGTRTGSPEGNSRFREHYQRMKNTRTPELAYQAGNFMLWESILAGYVQRASKGERWENQDLFGPDDETIAFVDAIRGKSALDASERSFLEYYDFFVSVAEELRVASA